MFSAFLAKFILVSQKVTKSARSRATSGSGNRRTTPSRHMSGSKRSSSQRQARSASFLDHVRTVDDTFRGFIYIVVALVVLVASVSPFFGPLGRDLKILAASLFGIGIYVALMALFLCGTALIFPERVHFARHRGSIGFLAAVTFGSIQGDLYQSISGPQIREKGGLFGYLIGHNASHFVGRFGGLLLLSTMFVLFSLAFVNIGPQRAVVGAVDFLKSYVSDDGIDNSPPVDGYNVDEKVSDPGSRGKTRTPLVKKLLGAGTNNSEASLGSGAGSNEVIDDLIVAGMMSGSAGAPEARVAKINKAKPGDHNALELSIERIGGIWKLPSPSLLKRGAIKSLDKDELANRGRILQNSLATHGVVTKLVGMTVGPTVTRYELELGEGVKVAKITSLNKDIAYAMAAADVRILAPIPGRSAIGVEVPNQNRQVVTLGDVLSSDEAGAAKHPLEVALGRDIAGRGVMANLAEMPHVLIAGATGSGKSSCINSIITSILMRATPDEVRLILVDPKRVELGQYNGLPHLLTQVVTNPKKAANALAWAVKEMERRYDLLSEVGVRDVTGYNQMVASLAAETSGLVKPNLASANQILDDSPLFNQQDGQSYERLPFILVVVDELNDLMMVAARDVEESICRIAQMARAVGIHLIIATQRPSVDVITGVIKANVPSRMAFSVSSLADSRVILDQPGAERLVGKGDMLLLTASSNVPRRIQGPWVSEAEVRAVVGHWLRSSKPQYVEGVEGAEGQSEFGFDASESDELLDQAIDLVVSSQLGSTSMLQRKLRVGFARAGRLMDLLEARGIVGPSEGSKPRVVLMSKEELENQREEGYF